MFIIHATAAAIVQVVLAGKRLRECARVSAGEEKREGEEQISFFSFLLSGLFLFDVL